MSMNNDHAESESTTPEIPDEILDSHPIQSDQVQDIGNGAHQLTVQALYIRVNTAISRLREATEELAKIVATSSALPKLQVTLQALACAAAQKSFPPLEVDDWLRALVADAKRGELNKYAEVAARLVKLELSSLIGAESALIVLYAIDEPIPTGCANLPFSLIAKRLNKTVLQITRTLVGLKLD